MKKIAVLIASWFYSGFIPSLMVTSMAGTYGSFFSLPLGYLALAGQYYFSWFYHAVVVFIFLIGWWSVHWAETEIGPRVDWHGKIRLRDQNQIVIDEVLGMLIACYPLIWIKVINFFWAFLIAFFFFRIFDLIKPWPASYFEQRKNALGVMMDDVIAGAYAAASLILILEALR